MKICPTCQSSKDLREIAYGLASSDLDESIYVSGGCVISEYDPTLKCINCGWLGEYREFFIPGLYLSRLFEGQDSYWIEIDNDGNWRGDLYRYLHQEDTVLEQYWDRKEVAWNHTMSLTRKFKSGETQMERILEDRARRLIPQAFVRESEDK